MKKFVKFFLKLIGDPVRDLVRHFIQYWNFAKDEVDSNQKSKNILAHKKSKEFSSGSEVSLKTKLKAKWQDFKMTYNIKYLN